MRRRRLDQAAARVVFAGQRPAQQLGQLVQVPATTATRTGPCAAADSRGQVAAARSRSRLRPAISVQFGRPVDATCPMRGARGPRRGSRTARRASASRACAARRGARRTLQHDVEVGAAEAERADPGDPLGRRDDVDR